MQGVCLREYADEIAQLCIEIALLTRSRLNLSLNKRFHVRSQRPMFSREEGKLFD
jgi:hypothetical protein